MGSPLTNAAIAGANHVLFDSLEREWRRALRSPALQAQAAVWAAAEPVLAGGSSLDIVSRVTWDGYQPAPASALILSALLRQAASPLAARALLQALVPRMRAERVCTPTYGHGLGESWPRPADTVADLVAECFAAIKRHAGEDRSDVARLIVGEAARRLRTARQAQQRYQARTAALVSAPAAAVAADISSARSGAEWLAGALVEAVRNGRLGTDQARLLYAIRVKGLPASEVGRCHGLAPKAVYYALACAERALLTSPAVARQPPWARAA